MRDRILIKNYFIKRALLTSGLKRSERTFFLSGNPIDLCDRLCLIMQEKQPGKDITRFAIEFVATIGILLDYKCITPTQHERIIEKIFLVRDRFVFSIFQI